MSSTTFQTEHYDLLALGSGEAGKYIAWTMASAGKKAAVIERRYIGGSCPNIACLPGKNIIYSAKVAHLAKHASDFGLHCRLLFRHEKWQDDIGDKVSEKMGHYRDPKIASEKVDTCEHCTTQQGDDDTRPALPIMKDREEKEGDRRRKKSVAGEGLKTLDGISSVK